MIHDLSRSSMSGAPGPRIPRHLAAIFAADVEGYSRLMDADEVGTIRTLTAHREIMDRLIGEHGGRIANTAGDSVLAEFPSVVDAVRAAVEVQEALETANEVLPEDRQVRFRVGVHVGDVMVKGGDLFGDGVNIAARLQALSEAGGLCISGSAHEHIRKVLPLAYEDLGAQQVKNIAEPVRTFSVRSSGRVVNPAVQSARDHSKSLPLPDKPSIAVLPLSNMSGDPDQEYFADGITEDLLTALSRIRWLFVIARNSSFVFKGKIVDVKEVGRQLGVRYVLEGSIRKAGNRVRITGQLVDAATGAHIWAERYDRDLTDIFEMQDEIVQQVVAALEPTLLNMEIASARAKPTESLAAYDLYLRALPEFHSFTEAGFRRAEALLRDALGRDPRYADAWAALAECLTRMAIAGWIADWDQASQQACDAARNTIDADPESGTGLAIAASTLANLGGKLDQAVEIANKALRLHPNSSTVCANCGWVFVLGAEYDRALALFEAARRVSPLDPRGYFTNTGTAGAYLFSRQFKEAELWTRKTLDKWPSHPASLRYRAAALVLLGRLDEARSVVSDVLRVQPNSSVSRSRKSSYRDQEMFRVYLDALRSAGLPE